MKTIDYLIIQSTDTGASVAVTLEDIIEVHTTPVQQGGYGWNRPGLDYLIHTDGVMDTLISEDNPTMVDLWGISEGKKGIQGVCKHIAYVGGRTEKETKGKDTRTKDQLHALEAIVRFYILKFPNIQILGFNEAPAKKGEDNPGFEVSIWLEEIGIPEHNIFKKLKQ